MRIKLSVLMFIIALVFSFSISLLDYYVHQEEAVKYYEEKLDFIEDTVSESLQTIDKVHSVFGCSTDRKLRESTEYLLDLYERNPRVEEWDIEMLANQLEVDIYMINEENIITNTSFLPDLGLNFKECCKTLNDILNDRRKKGDLYIDYMDVEQATGETKKYSYQATKDKKFIIQLSLPINESRVFEHFSFFPTVEQLRNKFSMIEDINILNIGGLSLGQKDQSFKMSPKRYDAFLQVRDYAKTVEVKEKYDSEDLVFRYVYYEPIEGMNSQDKRVLEIIYNERELKEILTDNRKRLLFQLSVVLIIILIMVFGIQKWISRQIYFARHDNLTGLKNRRAFEEFFIQEVKKDKKLTALIFIDLDNFKSVNDTYGHLRGDGLLQLVAKTLKKTVGEPNEVFRLGGDEFAIILVETSQQEINEKVKEIDENIQTAIREEPDLEGLNLKASIGVSIAPIDGIYLETLFEKADKAMYHAKEKERQKIIIYEDVLE